MWDTKKNPKGVETKHLSQSPREISKLDHWDRWQDWYARDLEHISVPSIASRGVLKPRPTFFQKRVPAFPAAFPLAEALVLYTEKNKHAAQYMISTTTAISNDEKRHMEVMKKKGGGVSGTKYHLRKTLGCFKNDFSVCKTK